MIGIGSRLCPWMGCGINDVLCKVFSHYKTALNMRWHPLPPHHNLLFHINTEHVECCVQLKGNPPFLRWWIFENILLLYLCKFSKLFCIWRILFCTVTLEICTGILRVASCLSLQGLGSSRTAKTLWMGGRKLLWNISNYTWHHVSEDYKSEAFCQDRFVDMKQDSRGWVVGFCELASVHFQSLVKLGFSLPAE